MQDVVRTSSGHVRRKKKRRRRNNRLYYILIALIIIIIFVILSLTVFFKLDSVTIYGDCEYTYEQIVDCMGISTGDNLFRLDTDELEEKVLLSFPNIETIKIRRKLPTSLKVEITACVASYMVECDGGYYTVSRNGKIMTDKLSAANDALLLIKGFELNEPLLGKYVEPVDEVKGEIVEELLLSFEKEKLDKIKYINLTDRYNIKMLYDDRLIIELGSSYDIKYKMDFVKEVIKDKVSDTFEGRLIYVGRNSMSLIKEDIHDNDNNYNINDGNGFDINT